VICFIDLFLLTKYVVFATSRISPRFGFLYLFILAEPIVLLSAFIRVSKIATPVSTS